MTIVTNCDDVGISVIAKGGKIGTVAGTDETAARAVELQYELQDGPCLQSIREEEAVYSDDLQTEQRWPRWATMAFEELGILSSLSLQLFVGSDSMGR